MSVEDSTPATEVRDSVRTRITAGHVILTIVTVVALACLAFASLTPVSVTIDGSAARVPLGSTLADLLAGGRLASGPGDLLSVEGKLLRKGGGRPPALFVNGAPAEGETPLPAGASVTSAPGADSVEPTRVVTAETTPKLRYVGSGPVESIEDSGTPGMVRSIVGTISGEEVSRTVVSKGEPMIVRRESAWRGAKRVALTFDDGPWPTTTDQVLGELTSAEVKATFFMIGRQVKARPEMAKRVADAGMEIGNHSYSHKYLSNASKSVVISEISKADTAIEKVVGSRPVWYRPAGGLTSPIVFREAARLKHRLVLWSIDPEDWARPGARKIARRVLDRVRPGSVILMHDGGGDRSQTVTALKKILTGLKARGYEMVTLSELYAK